MNKQSLGALITINVVLLAALLVVTLSPEPADAQFRGRGDYVMIAGAVTGRSQQAMIYLLELKSLRLVALLFNSANDEHEIIGGYTLAGDLEGGTSRRSGGRKKY